MAPDDLVEQGWILDAGEHHELLHVVLVGAARLRIVDVGEPREKFQCSNEVERAHISYFS